MKKKNVMLSAVFTGFVLALFFAVSSEGASVVSGGKTVKVNYALKVDGKVVDSSKAGKPIEFKTGAHQMIPGFEKGVMGMKLREKKSFKVSPEEGYGKEDPKAVKEVQKNQLPASITPKAGMILYAQGKDGQRFPVRIKEIKKDVVVMDFNHPLAGKTLNFDVEVVEIK